MEMANGGADLNEVLEAIKLIRDGDLQSWFAGWAELSERVLALAQSTGDAISSGHAYMRAHNYLRTAQFPLPHDDPKRPPAWDKCLVFFDKGLETLGVTCERIVIPYQGGKLRAQFFPGLPGAAKRPLIMLVGGYDSTLEELYPMLGKAALERGYSVLAYEGPGQGQVLRDGITMTPEWEKPTGAVLDQFLRSHAKPKQIVLIGMSMGGYFAPRAAAFDKRIDGVVAWDTCFDFGEVVNMFHKMSRDPILSQSADYKWFTGNAQWVTGTHTVEDAVGALQAYTLAPVAARITQPVLIMAGEEDYGIPMHQTADFQKSLVNAESVTTKIFDRLSGGAEHCQTGNSSLVHATVFDWVAKTFHAN
jgi:pimeloyl-ACP methyl ester carboxylesterase